MFNNNIHRHSSITGNDASLFFTVENNQLVLLEETNVSHNQLTLAQRSSRGSTNQGGENDTYPRASASGKQEGSIEIPNILTLVEVTTKKEKPWLSTLLTWENPVFALVPLFVITIILTRVYRRRAIIPGRLQSLVEVIVETIDNFVCEIMGKKEGRRFLPFVGSLFIYILFCNIMGLIPFLEAPTTSYKMTVALALCTFFYVQFVAITRRGVLGYVHYLAGEPRGLIMWMVAPLLFPVHIIGEIAKIFSLSLRLFGNIFGEDTLIGIFALLGLMAVSFIGVQPVVGIPLHLPFMLMALLTGIIQAFVFALLSMIYFVLVIPEEET